MKREIESPQTGARLGSEAGASPPVGGRVPGSAPAWWNAERLLHGVSPSLRPLVQWLQGRLFVESDEEAIPPQPPEVEGPAALEAAVGVLRTAIQKAAEGGAPARKIRLLHGRLDGEAARLTRGLLEARSADARRMLRDVSHDVRSPLNSILFLADALISEHSGALNAVQRRQLKVLYTAAVSLVGLVNDLIDTARLGDGTAIPVGRESFSVETVLNEVRQLVAPLAAHREIDLGFRLETLGPREGDRRLLTRVLLNLVTNAVQATEPGGRVAVSATEPDDDRLRLEVQDDGPGADIEELRAFLRDGEPPFAGTRSPGWTHGLGLSISGRLVRAAGGSLEVDTAPGEGCRFTVDLPFPSLPA